MFDQLVRRLRRRGDVHANVSVNSGRDGQVTATANTRLDPEEVERQSADVLPERQAMTVMQPPHIVGLPAQLVDGGESTIQPLPPEEA
jgi:hypothetical protein